MYLLVLLIFFTINNEHIQKCFFKEFAVVFTIPITFSEIIKARLLVDHQRLVFKVLINTN